MSHHKTIKKMPEKLDASQEQNRLYEQIERLHERLGELEKSKPPKVEEPTKFQQFKDSAINTGKEYIKHKAIDATYNYGVKPLATKAYENATEYVLGGIFDYAMNLEM